MKKHRRTGVILGAIDKIKKPLGGILVTAAIITMLGFAGHDDLKEAQSKSHLTHQVELKSESKSELKQEPKQEVKQEWKSLGEFKITAYCSCVRCCSIWAKNRPLDEDGKEIVYTASGERAEAGKTIAVDTSVIPFGTEVKIGDTIYTAQDTGSAVKGNVIDIYFDSHEDAVKHGAKYLEVEVRNE